MPVGVTPVDPDHSWDVQFQAMDRDWSEILVRRTRALLADWSGAMSQMRWQYDRLVSDGLWVTGPVGLPRYHRSGPRRRHAFTHAHVALDADWSGTGSAVRW